MMLFVEQRGSSSAATLLSAPALHEQGSRPHDAGLSCHPFPVLSPTPTHRRNKRRREDAGTGAGGKSGASKK